MKKFFSLLLILCLLCTCVCRAEAGITIIDAAGREVTLTAVPQRIVSGYYISTSLLIALGLREKLVGIEAKAHTRPLYALAAPELIDLPDVGTAKNFSLETCLSLEPDLVILPKALSSAAEELGAFGIPAIVVNPENLDRLFETITLLGEATGTGDRARRLTAVLNGYICKLSALTADTDPVRVYLAGNSSYLRTAGENMYQSTLISLAGGENTAAEISAASWQNISYEQLLTMDPAVIVMASDAAYTAQDILNDPELAELEAVRTGRVYAIPADVEAWDSPVPGTLLGSLYIAGVLHPGDYGEEAFAADVNAFYSEFYQIMPYGE